MSVALVADKCAGDTGWVVKSGTGSSAPARYGFSREVIAVAVRCYLRDGWAYRDVEELLAEFGDDRTRFADAKARKNYAGTSPITRASGKKKVVLARYARNQRLGDAVQQWAFGSLKGSSGARAYYDALRARKIGHHAALRQLANRLIGILHGCLKTGTLYDEGIAWAPHLTAAA